MPNSAAKDLRVADKILIAIHTVAKGKTTSVPYEEIVIEAWRRFPESFSLRNHPEYPDASDIHKRLSDPLKKEGYIVAIGNKMFRLTDKGVAQAEHLSNQLRGRSASSSTATSRLSRREEAFYQHASRSQPFLLWRQGRAEELIDYDAQQFFRFSTSTAVSERKRRIEVAREAFSKGEALGFDGASDLLQLTDYFTYRFATLFKE